jgi:hypothetical protein
MKLDIYEFTATEDCDGNDDREYTFNGYLLPTGAVLCPEEQTNDSFYESLDAVQAHGLAFVQSYKKIGSIDFSDDELRASVTGSAGEFGKSAIPESLRCYLVERITTGFLIGNLFSDETGIDVDASVRALDAALTEALEAEFPGAEITVGYQNASGALPHNLQTHVYLACAEPNFAEEERIADRVNSITERVFERGDWVMEREEARV